VPFCCNKVPPMSTVDVVVPCHNYAKYLPACVQSLVSQAGVKVRVLIIDDASSDDTAQVGERLATSHRGVEFRRHEVNKGNIATYNEGLLGWSTSEYVVLLSADDMLAPGSLSRAVGIMDADPSIGMVYGRAIHFEEESALPKVSMTEFAFTRFTGARWLEVRCRAGYNVIASPEVVVRGRIQRSVGGYRPELPHAGDLEMWLRIAAVSNIAYVRRVPQAFYRVHSDSMLRTTTARDKFLDLYERKKVFDAFFQHHEHTVANAACLHDLASRALAREALWRACRAYDRDKVEEDRASELEEFAIAVCPVARSLPEYRALGRRRRLGPVICNRTQLFAPTAVVRRIQRWALQKRWQRWGM